MYDIHLKNKDKDYDLIMRMVEMITNFARTGYDFVKLFFKIYSSYLICFLVLDQI